MISRKDLFKLNKNFLEEFKNYQIIKLNIRKAEDEFIRPQKQLMKRRKGIILNVGVINEDFNMIEKSLIQSKQEDLKK